MEWAANPSVYERLLAWESIVLQQSRLGFLRNFYGIKVIEFKIAVQFFPVQKCIWILRFKRSDRNGWNELKAGIIQMCSSLRICKFSLFTNPSFGTYQEAINVHAFVWNNFI